MKVLLIKPPQEKQTIFHIMPPLGLGYLATAIKNYCQETHIVDCVCDNISLLQLIIIVKERKPDVIGLSMLSHDVPMVKRITEAIKKEVSQEILTVVGGPHPSAAPEHTLRSLDHADFAFKGEAEIGFPQLLEAVKTNSTVHPTRLRSIPGLVYRDDQQIRINPQSFENNLDALGFPAWDMVDPQKYFKTCQGVFYKKTRFAPLFATRGCPYFCTFCAAHTVTGRKIRKRSVPHIIQEILHLQKEYRIEEFHLLDDNFTDDHNFAISFCAALIDQNIKIAWTCPNGVRIDSLTEPLLKKMQQSGCYSLFVAIESGCQETLNRMKKGLRINEIISRMKIIKKFDFDVTGFFILGYPGETAAQMSETIQFACSLPLDIADFSNFLPIPGGSVIKRIYGEDAAHHLDYKRLSSPAYTTNKSRAHKEKCIQKTMIRRAYLHFYLRGHILFKILGKIKSPYQIYFIVKRLYQYLLAKN